MSKIARLRAPFFILSHRCLLPVTFHAHRPKWPVTLERKSPISAVGSSVAVHDQRKQRGVMVRWWVGPGSIQWWSRMSHLNLQAVCVSVDCFLQSTAPVCCLVVFLSYLGPEPRHGARLPEHNPFQVTHLRHIS